MAPRRVDEAATGSAHDLKTRLRVADPGAFGDRYLILGALIGLLSGVAVYLLSRVWPSF
jgi:hypothetical protein